MNDKTKFTRGLPFFLILLVCMASSLTMAAENQSQKFMNTLENMKMLSQQIPKDYFYIQQNVRTAKAKKELGSGLSALDQDLKYLAAKIKDSEGANLLLFLTFTRDELKSLLQERYTAENGALILDYGESLLEGADALLQNASRKIGKKQVIIIIVEEMLVDLERITKYYIAFRAGFTDYSNVKQMQSSIASFESKLETINSQKSFVKKHAKSVAKLNKYWPISKKFYMGIEKKNLPVIVFIATEHMEKSLFQLLK